MPHPYEFNHHKCSDAIVFCDRCKRVSIKSPIAIPILFNNTCRRFVCSSLARSLARSLC